MLYIFRNFTEKKPLFGSYPVNGEGEKGDDYMRLVTSPRPLHAYFDETTSCTTQKFSKLTF